MNIIEWLTKQGYNVDNSMESHIDTWRSWYEGDVKDFHYYRVYNGQKSIHCKRKTLGMAKQICQDWADLLLNEKVRINHPDEETQNFIIKVLDDSNFWVRGNQAIEDAFWSGLVACLPHPSGVEVADSKIVKVDRLQLSFSVGKQIIPITVENGECTECAFASETKIGDKKYTVLQICLKENGQYVIYNRLLDTSNGCEEVNNPGDIPQFSHLVAKWNTGLTEPPFVFIRPNIKNSINPESPFGLSVFAGAIDILKGLDVVYDAYINEYVLGKTRVMVKAEAVKFSNDTPAFDPNDIAFYVMEPGITDDPYIKEIQPAIRAEQMQTGLNDNLNLLSMRCGLGEQHYKFSDRSIQTATQVVSENSHMFRTLKKHEIVLEAFFKRLARLIVQYGRVYMGLSLNESDITIDFDDSIIEDKTALNNDMRLDVSAGLLKPEIYLMKKYNVSEEEARKMIPQVSQEYLYAGGGVE